jgi:hypothetical protein
MAFVSKRESGQAKKKENGERSASHREASEQDEICRAIV